MISSNVNLKMSVGWNIFKFHSNDQMLESVRSTVERTEHVRNSDLVITRLDVTLN